MSRNRLIGEKGENLACNYLKTQGYEIVAQNWTTGHKEIDIICHQNNCFFFIEVKTRLSLKSGMPEEAINEKKINAVTEAARIYLYDMVYQDIRFDVISIHLKSEDDYELLHIKDAFY